MRKPMTICLIPLAVLIAVTACQSTTPDLTAAPRPFKDPVIARADIVYDQGPATCPLMTRAANGDLIVGWGTRGDGMPGSVTQFVRSADQGKSWSAPFLTIKTDKPHTGIAAYLQQLPLRNPNPPTMLVGQFELEWPATTPPDETKPSQYLQLAAQRNFDYFYSFSYDNGLTFTERRRLNDPIKRNDFPQGNILELPNGDLLWPWGYWGDQPLNGFRRSTDGGLTWLPVQRAWQDPPPGQEKPLGFNETAVIVGKNGSLVAVARVDALVGKHFWLIKSDDNGQTWTAPRKIDIAGGSPALYCTEQGQLWLGYRDGGLGPGLGLAVSDDNGDSWRFLYHLQEPRGEHVKLYGHIRYTDEDRRKSWRPAEGVVGYPCFQKLSADEVYVVYHAQNRGELPQRYPAGADPFYIVGNLLVIK